MAIAYDNASTGIGNYVTSLTFSHTCTGSNLELLVGTVVNQSTTVSSVTYAAAACTAIDSQASGGGTYRSDLRHKIGPATGANNVVVTPAVQTYMVAIAVSYTGVHQTTPLGTAAKANGGSTASTVDVSSAAGELVVDITGTALSGVMTAGANQTQRGQVAANSDTRGAMSEEAGAATVTMSWSWAISETWMVVAVPLKPVAAAGGNPWYAYAQQ